MFSSCSLLRERSSLNAENENERLQKENCHLCDIRFNFELNDWEDVQSATAELKEEIKALTTSLADRDKVGHHYSIYNIKGISNP